MNKLNVDKKIIGFDMDGVILNNSKTKIELARKLGFNLELHHTPFEIMRTMLPQVVLEELQKMLYFTHEIAVKTPLIKGARNILMELSQKNIPYYLISRRKLPEIAIKTLRQRRVWPKYFNDNNSYFVDRPEDKDSQACKLGITHYIDDELRNIDALVSVPNKYLFDPFNVFKDAKHYTRIKSWQEFNTHIDL